MPENPTHCTVVNVSPNLCSFLCECAAFPKNQEAERDLVHETDLMQLAVDDIGTSGRYDTRDDFTVITQPFFNKTYLPKIVSLISVCLSVSL